MLAFTPPQKPYNAMLFSFSCGAAALILFALSSYIGHRYLLLPILAGALLLAGIWFLYRFALLSYRYEIHDGVLCVIRVLFRRARTVYTLSLRTAFAVMPMSDPRRKTSGKPRRTHNFVNNWPTDDAVVLYYRDAGFVCAVILEDNPAFFAAAGRYFTGTEPNDA